MRKGISIIISLVITVSSFSQDHAVTYEQLKEYEGLYYYFDSATLTFAASPRDTVLYVILNDAKYPLKPFQKDVFLNNDKEEITFLRDKKIP